LYIDVQGLGVCRRCDERPSAITSGCDRLSVRRIAADGGTIYGKLAKLRLN
jgi:hypothetical protein